jgi:hypothetical protein
MVDSRDFTTRSRCVPTDARCALAHTAHSGLVDLAVLRDAMPSSGSAIDRFDATELERRSFIRNALRRWPGTDPSALAHLERLCLGRHPMDRIALGYLQAMLGVPSGDPHESNAFGTRARTRLRFGGFPTPSAPCPLWIAMDDSKDPMEWKIRTSMALHQRNAMVDDSDGLAGGPHAHPGICPVWYCGLVPMTRSRNMAPIRLKLVSPFRCHSDLSDAIRNRPAEESQTTW